LDIDSQLKLLKQRNLCINDEERVKRYLSFISYYRLSAYFEPYQLLGEEDFIKGVTFDTVLDTYLFDRKLRLLVLDAIERIETAIKAQLANKYSVVYGANWLENIELFKNTRKFHKQLIWIDDILKNTGNTEQFISIFKKEHQGALQHG
jgi:abortive infection bacteriophage resistance protein